MRIDVMRAKLHRITVTEADLNYIGSITLDQDLIEAAGLVPGREGANRELQQRRADGDLRDRRRAREEARCA